MPNEPFWTDLQSIYKRIPTIEQRRREARTTALAACANHLNQQLHDILQTLNLRALAQRCSASVPTLPSRRAEHLQPAPDLTIVGNAISRGNAARSSWTCSTNSPAAPRTPRA